MTTETAEATTTTEQGTTTQQTTTEQTTQQTTAQPASTAMAKPVPLHERIPEQFRVKKGEEFDVEGSVTKMAESYQQLQARMREGGAPPKAAEEYQITVPDALKETFKEDERTAAFRKDAHELGLTQKQFDGMMGKFFGLVPELAGSIIQDRAEVVIGNLEKAWGDKYDAELAGAMKAFDAYAEGEDKGKFDNIMQDPSIAYRVLAKVSRELGEAPPMPRDTGGTGGEDVQTLMRSEAYWNTKHPDHAKVSERVRMHYEKTAGKEPVR